MGSFSFEICYVVLEQLQLTLLIVCLFCRNVSMGETVFYVVSSNIFTYVCLFLSQQPICFGDAWIIYSHYFTCLGKYICKRLAKGVNFHLRRDDHRSTLMFYYAVYADTLPTSQFKGYVLYVNRCSRQPEVKGNLIREGSSRNNYIKPFFRSMLFDTEMKSVIQIIFCQD